MMLIRKETREEEREEILEEANSITLRQQATQDANFIVCGMAGLSIGAAGLAAAGFILGPKTQGVTKTHIPVSGDWLQQSGIAGVIIYAATSYWAAKKAQQLSPGQEDKRFYNSIAVMCGVMSVLSAGAIAHEQIENFSGYNLGVNTNYDADIDVPGDIVSWSIFGMSLASTLISGAAATLYAYQYCNREAVITRVEENISNRSTAAHMDEPISGLDLESFIVADPYHSRENEAEPELAEVKMDGFSGYVLNSGDIGDESLGV